ncbi:hypothetical protein BJY01DRAFT_235496 [Aspergillus pseudoustus]|uniref:Uncharacterized protein n=1 Tax=Aspergillus pseudoustus TaxID=1810923 RepID=A0ABR4JUX5_9EURO
MPLERKMSRPVGRSNSVRSPPTQPDSPAPAIPTLDTETFDTALPPMSSKQLVVANRRPQGALQRLPYPQNLTSVSGGPGAHRRTGSTLKTVMRKIFTRNRRSRTDELDDPIQDFEFGSQFGSSIGPIGGRNGDRSPNPAKSESSQHSSQLQQNGEPLTTLDVVLKQLDNEPRQRRATLPSLIFSDEGSRQALEAVVHPNKGPKLRKLSPHAKSDPEEAQRGQLRSIKRRSRSAGALRLMAKEHRMSPIQWRRPRSAESDYGASTTHGIASDSEASSRPPTRTTVASASGSISKPSAEVSVFEEDEPEDDEPSLPPNVGELISSMQNDESATLEQRLTTLEVKLIDLEFAIARMQSGRGDTPGDSPNPKALQDPSRHKRQKSSGYSQPSRSGRSPTPEHVAGADRPVSTSTIRPSLSDIHRARALQAPSMVSLSDSGAISVQQYSALVMLLRREQTARRNLEQQVTGLREDVERLHRMARDSVGVGTMYPIRSVESQEYLRLRPDDSPRSSLKPTDEKITPRYESDSDWSERPKEDRFRPWQPTRRIEVANMI